MRVASIQRFIQWLVSRVPSEGQRYILLRYVFRGPCNPLGEGEGDDVGRGVAGGAGIVSDHALSPLHTHQRRYTKIFLFYKTDVEGSN